MTHPARRKGVQAESAARDWLRHNGYPHCERIPAGMADDRGDLAGIPHTVVQVKAYRDLTRAIRDAMHDVATQQRAADATYGLPIVKRPGVTDPGQWIVPLTLADYVQLRLELDAAQRRAAS